MAKTKLTMKTSEEVKKEAAPVAVPVTEVKTEVPQLTRIFVVTGEGATMEIGYRLVGSGHKLADREFASYGKAKKFAMDALLKYVDAAREVRHQMWLHRQKKCNQIAN